MSFRLKMLLGIAAIEIFLLSILLASGIYYLKSSNEDQLIKRAKTTADLLGTMVADSLIALDIATIDELLRQTIQNPEIVFLRIRNNNGLSIAEKGDEILLKLPFKASSTADEINNGVVFSAVSNVTVENNVFGRVEVGIDIKFLNDLIKSAQRQFILLAGVEILFVAIFGILLGRFLIGQLNLLQQGARRIAQGDLGYTIPVIGNDELADTAKSFNYMSLSLKDYSNRLNELLFQAKSGEDKALSILEDAVTGLDHGMVISDKDGQILQLNNAFLELYGLSAQEVSLIKNVDELAEFSWKRSDSGKVFEADESGRISHRTMLINGRHVYHSQQEMTKGGSVFTDTDITEIIKAEEKVRILEHELMQNLRLEALGTLAGGIAHEINTPIQYIGDNLRFLKDASEDFLNIIGIQNNLVDAAESAGLLSQETVECRAAFENFDLGYLREEVPKATDQSIDGIHQVSTIIQAMKEFSHPTSAERGPIELNRCIERTSVICRSEWKLFAELELNLQDDLPTLYGHEGQINQVILNLIVNAAHAIEEKGASLGRIVVRSNCVGDDILFSIEDTGPGIPKDVQDRIFDPFFTTKKVGKGTGQGLTLCRDIIVNKHGGQLNVKSDEGKGTTFTVILPIGNAE